MEIIDKLENDLKEIILTNIHKGDRKILGEIYIFLINSMNKYKNELGFNEGEDEYLKRKLKEYIKISIRNWIDDVFNIKKINKDRNSIDYIVGNLVGLINYNLPF